MILWDRWNGICIHLRNYVPQMYHIELEQGNNFNMFWDDINIFGIGKSVYREC